MLRDVSTHSGFARRSRGWGCREGLGNEVGLAVLRLAGPDGGDGAPRAAASANGILVGGGGGLRPSTPSSLLRRTSMRMQRIEFGHKNKLIGVLGGRRPNGGPSSLSENLFSRDGAATPGPPHPRSSFIKRGHDAPLANAMATPNERNKPEKTRSAPGQPPASVTTARRRPRGA